MCAFAGSLALEPEAAIYVERLWMATRTLDESGLFLPRVPGGWGYRLKTVFGGDAYRILSSCRNLRSLALDKVFCEHYHSTSPVPFKLEEFIGNAASIWRFNDLLRSARRVYIVGATYALDSWPLADMIPHFGTHLQSIEIFCSSLNSFFAASSSRCLCIIHRLRHSSSSGATTPSAS
jgi:hypothetical protein